MNVTFEKAFRRPLHVAVITETLHPEIGGVGRMAYFVARALLEQGVRVTVFAPSKARASGVECTEHEGFFRVFRYPRGGKFWFVQSAQKVIAAMRQAGLEADVPDVFYHHFPYALPKLKRAHPHSRHILQVHSPLLEEGMANRGWWWYPVLKVLERTIERTAIREADRLIVLSDYLRLLMLRKYPELNPQKLVKLRSGLVSRPGHHGSDKATLRRRHGIPVDAKVVIISRRHVRRTGVLEFAQAVRRHRAGSGLHFIFTGEGYLFPRIQSLIGGRPNVTLTRHVDDARLEELTTLADLSVIPTRTLECFGLSTLEGLARGLPVLVTDISANPEIIRELGGGLAIPFGVAEFDRALDALAGGRLVFPPIARNRLANWTFEQHAAGFLELVGWKSEGRAA